MHLIIFGDSIAQGFFDSECGGWVSRLSAKSNKEILDSNYESDISFFNLGISADCTNLLLKRFDSEAKARLVDKDGAIIFSIGVNDTQRYVETSKLKTTPEQFEANIRELVKQSRVYTEKIIFLGILPIVEDVLQPMPWASDRGYYNKDVLEFDALLKRICEEVEVSYFLMQDVLGEEKSDFLPDGLHPNAAGHELIFQRVKSVLESENLL